VLLSSTPTNENAFSHKSTWINKDNMKNTTTAGASLVKKFGTGARAGHDYDGVRHNSPTRRTLAQNRTGVAPSTAWARPTGRATAYMA
jgi:hypothetical protein